MSEPKSIVARVLQRMGDALRAARSAGDLTANDVRMKLDQAIRALDPRVYYVDDYAPGKGEVYYSVYADGKYECYSRKYTLAADGSVTISGDPVEVEPVLSYEPVSKTEVVAAAAAEPAITAAAASCSCQHPKVEAAPAVEAEAVAPVVSATSTAKENGTMTKDELIAKLADASPEQLANAALAFSTPAAAAPAPAAVAEPVAAAAATPQLTDEEKEALAFGTKALRAAKAASIKALKDSGRCKISDERLNAMSQSALDELVALTGVEAAAPAAVDYGLNGAPRAAAAAEEEVPAAPDMMAGLRAARQFKDMPAGK